MARKKVEKYLLVVTGLHIGGSAEYEIGGVDNVVVKDPWGYPYIPGSSLKGKLRSLLEKEAGKEEVCKCGKCDICNVFGYVSNDGKQAKTGAAIFRDAFVETQVSEEIKNKIKEDFPYISEVLTRESVDSPLDLVEVKFENTIDRISGTTLGGLRQTERVKPGVLFRLDIIIDEKFEQYITNALNKLENDYLGGNGTRGYGTIKFYDIK
ncbi:MAG: type III-A CRISPR-associated RAMP protein Csm3 [Candidatus Anstonellales archaeon]